MKERPILFSAPMVRAILDGKKTQTRRIVKPLPLRLNRETNSMEIDEEAMADGRIMRLNRFGQPGDRLWVRETWGYHPDYSESCRRVDYRADPGHTYDGHRWRPSIHMPRWASRISLEVVSVRVERLHDISEADALAEGIKRYSFRPDDGWPLCDGYTHLPDDGKCTLYPTAAEAYRELWESINGTGSWDANPWVWVIEFKKVAA